MVDAWEPERILWAIFVEVCVVDIHPPLVVVVLEDEDGVSQPLGVVNFFDEPCCE